MPLKKTLWQIEQFIVYRILHADDSPHRLALSIAIGLFIAWTPTVGIQMVLVLATTTLFRANKLVGIPLVWISNPLTIVPIYYGNYRLGKYLLGIFSERDSCSHENFREILYKFTSTNIMQQLFSLAAWEQAFKVVFDISCELWLGSIIIGVLLAIPAYFLSYQTIVWYRKNKPHLRLLHKHQGLDDSDQDQNEQE